MARGPSVDSLRPAAGCLRPGYQFAASMSGVLSHIAFGTLDIGKVLSVVLVGGGGWKLSLPAAASSGRSAARWGAPFFAPREWAIATHVEPRRQVTVTRTWGLSRAAPLRGLGREAPQRRQPKNGPARRHRSPGRHGLAARDLRAPGCRCRRRARSADCTSPAAASARRQFCPTASLLLPYPPPAPCPSRPRRARHARLVSSAGTCTFAAWRAIP